MRVYLETTGCRLNQSEVETIARQFGSVGHAIVQDVSEADLVVINTCAVTREATRSSRNLIRRVNRHNPDVRIVATGCYAHLMPEAVGALPGVEQVVNNLEKDRLVPLVTGADLPADVFDAEPLVREPVAGALGRTRAFVKVQDGCNNRCTFCVTTVARGPGRSRTIEEIVREVQALAVAGYKEAVLTGVHLGSYGHDHGTRDGLTRLVRALLAGTDMPRLRLSSLEPWDISPDFFDLWADERLCRHLHLPLQSGCDATLRRMARRTSQAAFRELVTSARTAIPDLAISTDMIAGFPGETDEEFDASYEFAQEMAFMKIHAFRYSARAGTAAARMPDQIPPDVKKERSARLLALSDSGARAFAQRFVGSALPVLWEHVSGASERGFRNSGLTGNYLRVVMDAPGVLTNTITPVRLAAVTDEGLLGQIVGAVPRTVRE